jgi:RHS repeat-associated protein
VIVTVNNKNQLMGPPYQYDAAGNMTHDASHSYTYDAENRIIQVDGGNTASYRYDGLGRRVQKTVAGVSTDYVYDLSSNVIAEYSPSCSGAECWTTGHVYLNNSLLAEYKNATTYFVHGDHLGSSRLVTAYPWVDAVHSIVDNMDYLPFGEQIAGGTGSSHKFTGDERDAETSLDHTQFRQYTSQLARWMSPDPAGLAAVDPTNPQSWNRYAYVGNDPMDWIDPSGLGGICLAFLYDGGCGGGGPSWPTVWEASDSWDWGYYPIFWADGGGGGGGNPPQKSGGTNPPPNNPGTTFPGTPIGMNVCVSIPGAQICATTPYPSWFVNAVKSLSAAGLLTRVFLQALGRNFVDEFNPGGCVNTFFNASLNALNPFAPSASTLGDPAAALYSASRFNALLKYAASRPNYLGGQGLLYPLKSSVFRSMLSDATTSSGAGFAVSADLSLAQGFATEMYQLATGGCR